MIAVKYEHLKTGIDRWAQESGSTVLSSIFSLLRFEGFFEKMEGSECQCPACKFASPRQTATVPHLSAMRGFHHVWELCKRGYLGTSSSGWRHHEKHSRQAECLRFVDTLVAVGSSSPDVSW
jgi:hypothetical protein